MKLKNFIKPLLKIRWDIWLKGRRWFTICPCRTVSDFNNVDLYPTVLEKAAALIESILKNHPFIDGNKRTGYVLTLLLLLSNSYDIVASQDFKYQFVVDIASGKMKFEEILS